MSCCPISVIFSVLFLGVPNVTSGFCGGNGNMGSMPILDAYVNWIVVRLDRTLGN